LLPIVLDEATSGWLLDHPGVELDIDLENTTLTLPDGRTQRFPLEAFARYCLVNGIDELGYLLSQQQRIAEYERTRA
jgi:3-isopropylmalate/(R)-2-methylmalate dehydratase small subunit